jgi:hypothetical protein
MGYAVATGDELLRSDWARRVEESKIGVEIVDRALLDIWDVWKVMTRVIVVGGELQWRGLEYEEIFQTVRRS